MQGDIPMIRSRVMPLFVLSTAVLVSGCVTSVKIRKPSATCPTCQQGQYGSAPSAPMNNLNLSPIPEIPPSNGQGGSELTTPPAPYPAPPPEARRLLPNFRNRTISTVPSDAANPFD